MSPLTVIQTLSQSPNACLGLVRDYLIRLTEREDARMKEDLAVIEKYKADTAKLREQNQKLKEDAVVFQVDLSSEKDGFFFRQK